MRDGNQLAMLFFVLSSRYRRKALEEIVNSIVSSYLSLGKIPPYKIYDLGLCFLIASPYAWLNLMITRIIANMRSTVYHKAYGAVAGSCRAIST